MSYPHNVVPISVGGEVEPPQKPRRARDSKGRFVPATPSPAPAPQAPTPVILEHAPQGVETPRQEANPPQQSTPVRGPAPQPPQGVNQPQSPPAMQAEPPCQEGIPANPPKARGTTDPRASRRQLRRQRVIRGRGRR